MKDIQSIIHIMIEKHVEGGTSYFLGTCPELEGLLIEGDTIEELQKEAPGVIKMYIDAAREIEQNKKDSILNGFPINGKLDIFFNYNWRQHLTLA